MTTDTLLSFLLFAFVTAITPGPNNILLMTSGVNHGFRKTIPHLLGVTFGFAMLVLGTGLGLNELFSRFPAIYQVMKWFCTVYFVYLAWKLAMAPTGTTTSDTVAPSPRAAWRFRDGVAFQWINPKGWIMAVGTFSSYVPAVGGVHLVIGAALLFALICFPAFIVWVTFGSRMRHYLDQGNRRRIFNIAMALLLLSSLIPLFASPSHST